MIHLSPSSHAKATNLLGEDWHNIQKDCPFHNLGTARGGQATHVAEEFQVVGLLG